MRYLLILAVFVCATTSIAQEPPAQPDGWHGLVVDVSTGEDAIRILGQPSSDKSAQSLHLNLVDKWLEGGKYNQKIFRRLTFKKLEGLEQVQLSFFDNKLVLIQLETRTGEVPDWVDPDDLAAMFNAKFTYSEWHLGKKLPPLAEFEKLDSTVPAKFSELYYMIAITTRSFIVAGVDNIKSRGLSPIGPPCTGCANAENKKRKARDAGGNLPGQVWSIAIVSRKLGSNQAPTAAQ